MGGWADGWIEDGWWMDEEWMDGLKMDGWINGWEWVDGWEDGWMDEKGWMDGWVDRWMDENGWMDGWEWMNGWMDGWMDGWIDGWLDGWMGRWVDGWLIAVGLNEQSVLNTENKGEDKKTPEAEPLPSIFSILSTWKDILPELPYTQITSAHSSKASTKTTSSAVISITHLLPTLLALWEKWNDRHSQKKRKNKFWDLKSDHCIWEKWSSQQEFFQKEIHEKYCLMLVPAWGLWNLACVKVSIDYAHWPICWTKTFSKHLLWARLCVRSWGLSINQQSSAPRGSQSDGGRNNPTGRQYDGSNTMQ